MIGSNSKTAHFIYNKVIGGHRLWIWMKMRRDANKLMKS